MSTFILLRVVFKGPVIRATFFFNLHAALLRCKLKNIVARITTHLKHCHATTFRCCKLKQHVASSWTGVYLFQQMISTCNNIFCCVTMLFEVGGNTACWLIQLAMQQCCVASCSNLLLVLLHLKYNPTNLFN